MLSLSGSTGLGLPLSAPPLTFLLVNLDILSSSLPVNGSRPHGRHCRPQGDGVPSSRARTSPFRCLRPHLLPSMIMASSAHLPLTLWRPFVAPLPPLAPLRPRGRLRLSSAIDALRPTPVEWAHHFFMVVATTWTDAKMTATDSHNADGSPPTLRLELSATPRIE